MLLSLICCLQDCSAPAPCSAMRLAMFWVRFSTRQLCLPCVLPWSVPVRTLWSDTRRQRLWDPSAKRTAWLCCSDTVETESVWLKRVVKLPWICWSMKIVTSFSMQMDWSGYRVKHHFSPDIQHPDASNTPAVHGWIREHYWVILWKINQFSKSLSNQLVSF